MRGACRAGVTSALDFSLLRARLGLGDAPEAAPDVSERSMTCGLTFGLTELEPATPAPAMGRGGVLGLLIDHPLSHSQ
jgi:hypothetical protein